MEGETVVFRDIFSNALETLRDKFSLDDIEIQIAAHDLNVAYSAENQKLYCTDEPVNYNNPSYRCAYLHKYAGCHAAMIDHVLSYYLAHTSALNQIRQTRGTLNICCLGGGPGTDVIGLWPTLIDNLEVTTLQFTIVDCMEEWASTFETVLEEALLMEDNESLREFRSRLVSFSYVCDNLLNPSEKTMESIGSADLVTMVKLVSAVDPRKAPSMLQALFRELRPGAVVLFIDNAAGGFHQIVSQAATDCSLTELCDPLRHIRFESDVFKQHRFGTSRLSSTTVTAKMWMGNSRNIANEFSPLTIKPLFLLPPDGDFRDLATDYKEREDSGEDDGRRLVFENISLELNGESYLEFVSAASNEKQFPEKLVSQGSGQIANTNKSRKKKKWKKNKKKGK